jgi:small subunit ribosomal protein S18
MFCIEKIDYLDYKDTTRLRKLISDRGKILPRRTTGTCAKHQRMVTRAIKRSRAIALLPYVAE